MKHWFALSAIGRDRPGIVADLAELIYDCDCNLGEFWDGAHVGGAKLTPQVQRIVVCGNEAILLFRISHARRAAACTWTPATTYW
jgi:hypothetical protein